VRERERGGKVRGGEKESEGSYGSRAGKGINKWFPHLHIEDGKNISPLLFFLLSGEEKEGE